MGWLVFGWHRQEEPKEDISWLMVQLDGADRSRIPQEAGSGSGRANQESKGMHVSPLRGEGAALRGSPRAVTVLPVGAST